MKHDRRLAAARHALRCRPRAPARARAWRRRLPRATPLRDRWSTAASCVNFCSNDYLGLARDPAVSRTRWPRQRDVGAPAPARRTWSPATRANITRWRKSWQHSPGARRALLFSTGYMANLGVISALAARGEISAAGSPQSRLAARWRAAVGCARCCAIAHADAAGGRARAGRSGGDAALLATDGVFSMDGDVAPLGELARLRRARSAPGCWWMMRTASACWAPAAAARSQPPGLDSDEGAAAGRHAGQGLRQLRRLRRRRARARSS